jgi:hypothetical protein
MRPIAHRDPDSEGRYYMIEICDMWANAFAYVGGLTTGYPLQFWEIFSAAMNENPPPKSEIEAVLPQFKYLGIELGKPWNRKIVQPQILDQMKLAAERIGPMMMPLLPFLGNTVNGWNIPSANVGMPGGDYPVRALVAVFGLTANTTSEAIYYTSVSDGAGKPLSGANRYALTFNEKTPCIEAVSPGFWSITAYDSATGFTIPNAIDRYALDSDSDLARNPGGSFTIYVQSDDPGQERRANWLPTSSGPFYLIIRVYAPMPAVAEGLKNPKAFQGPPPILPVG